MNRLTVTMAELDFLRALHARPRFFRWLFKIAVGRWAYREYQLMVWNAEQGDWDAFYDYDLQDCSYHHGKFVNGEKEFYERVGI